MLGDLTNRRVKFRSLTKYIDTALAARRLKAGGGKCGQMHLEVGKFIVPPKTLSGCPAFESFARRGVLLRNTNSHEMTATRPGFSASWPTVSAAEAYAFEELVAELGAAFICAALELGHSCARTMPPISPLG